MTNILDVVAINKKVKTQKYDELEVTGLSLEGIVYLVKSHPELVDIFKGGVDINMSQILDLGLDVVTSFLAAGLGHPGNPSVLEKCRAMNAEDALAVGTAIMEESFPGGAANFFNRITQLAGSAQGLMRATAVSADAPEAKAEPAS